MFNDFHDPLSVTFATCDDVDSLDLIHSQTYLNNFLIIHQNIRSMRKNFDNFLVHLNSFLIKPDLIFLSEAWIYDEEVLLFDIEGYTFIYCCNNEYASGGVVAFIKNSVSFEYYRYNLNSCDVLKVECLLDGRKLILFCFYRFHKPATFNSVFLEELENLLESESSNDLILLGDINIDILESSIFIDNYLFLLSSYGLQSCINKPTRVTDLSTSCLDHIFVRFLNSHKFSFGSSVIDLQITDHCMTCLSLKNVFQNIQNTPSSILSFNKTDYVALNNLLRFEQWEKTFNASDPSKAYSYFIETLNMHVRRCTRTVVKKENKLKKIKPWITNEILNKIKSKNKLYKHKKKYPINLSIITAYKKICKEISKDVLHCKNKFYLNNFNKVRGNPKKEWKLVNDILNKTNRSQLIQSLKVNDEVITDHNELAEKFNTFFASVGSKVVSESCRDISQCGCLALDWISSQSFFFEPITSFEVYKIVMSLKNSNSSITDGFSNNVVKKIAFNICDVLCYIFNNSVSNGVFPDELKQAEVIPLFKTGDKTSLNNYRPISLLSVFSKIFEKAMKGRITSFLEKNKFFSECQFGFRSGLSTEGALLNFCSNIYNGFNGKNLTAALFVDITKAFDTVDHKILLDKLYKYGFRGSLHKWFCSYLSFRKQRVRVNGQFSSSSSLSLGVPQGSVLGPILFLIFINSLFSQNFRCKINAFADDMACTFSSDSALNLSADINHDLELISHWFKMNKMVISDKTKIMFFNVTGKDAEFGSFLFHCANCNKYKHCKEICKSAGNSQTFFESRSCSDKCFTVLSVKSYKYLGVLLDWKMGWADHTNALKKYLLAAIRHIYLLKSYCSRDLLKCIYYGLVHSKIEYGIVCWGGAYNNKTHPILVSQKHAIRLICNKSRRSSSLILFRNLNVLPLRHLYFFKVLKVFFARSGYLLNRHCISYNLRINRQNLAVIPHHNLQIFFNFFTSVAPRLFNSLPYYIRSIRHESTFLRNVRLWLVDLNYEDIDVLLRVTI